MKWRMLREHATLEELEKLDFSDFEPTKGDRCIYGQMTGFCSTPRAKELMDKACVRIFDLSHTICEGVGALRQKNITDTLSLVNGKYEGQTWQNTPTTHMIIPFYKRRKYTHLSALEGYICAKDANTSGIIAFLKGESEVLDL
jgi:hypothetical protein